MCDCSLFLFRAGSPTRFGLAKGGPMEQCDFSFFKALVQIKFKWDLNFQNSMDLHLNLEFGQLNPEI
jgi:hypothetical protein